MPTSTADPVPATVTDMDAFLRPRSIAVVGASAKPGLPAMTLRNLVKSEFTGSIFPINPKYEELEGTRCYPSLDAVPGQVDLALLLVPARATPAVLEECGRAGVKVAVIFGSGFAETGEEGALLQQWVLDAARRSGVRILGPNCQGFLYLPNKVVASFTPAAGQEFAPDSGVAYVGQSGAVGGALMAMARDRSLGMTAWFSTGNQMDLSAAEIASDLLEQDSVRVLAMYLETIPDGREWAEVCKRAREQRKPIVVLRSGLSESGRRAASSHTGAMVRPDAAYRLFNEKYGVIEVTDVRDLVDVVDVLSRGSRPSGLRVSVITSSGGAGGLFADALDEAGLELASLAPETAEELTAVVPDFGSVVNPVDVTAQLFSLGDEAFARACAPLLSDPGTDALVVVLTGVNGERGRVIAEGITRLARETDKHLGVVWLAAQSELVDAIRVLQDAGVVVTDSLSHYANLLRIVSAGTVDLGDDTAPRRLSAHARTVADDLIDSGVTTEAGGAALLDALGITRPRAFLARSEDEARTAVATIDADRYVLKAQSAQVQHKSDVGGVLLNVPAQDVPARLSEMSAAMRTLPGVELDGVLVQEFAGGDVELIVGVQGARHGYPPVMTVGAGGTSTELYADVQSAVCPLSTATARRLLMRLKAWPLLDGYRDAPPLDIDAVVASVVALSELADYAGSRLGEIEINPLGVSETSASALDLLIEPVSKELEN